MKPLRVPIFHPKSMHRTVLRQRLHRSCPSYVPYTSGFHTTSPRPFPDVFLVAYWVLENSHGIEGLPWSASIPFTALFVFAFTRGPIAMYLQIVLRRQRDIEPHLHKVRLKLEKTVMRVDADKTAAERVARVNVLYQDACTAARKSHNCQHWKLWLVFTKFPVWYVMMETIRRMTGTEKGFIDLVRSALGKRDFSGFSEPSAFVEPSFATEGALWFSNLQQADPYLILPFILSATLFIRAQRGYGSIRIMFERKMEDRDKAYAIEPHRYDPDLPNNFLRCKRMAELFALAAGPATLQFPSAMLLYWITHSVCELMTAVFLRHWGPIIRPRAPVTVRPNVQKQRFRGPKMQDLRPPTKRKNK